MNAFSWIFLGFLAASVIVRWWLLRRQIRSVVDHRGQVPEPFADRITLEAHRKAADYTLARAGAQKLELLLTPLILLAWTLGGGLNWLDNALLGLGLTPLWHGVALVFAVVLIGGLLELPLSLYHTFVIENRFGFNRMTPMQYVRDLAMQLVLGAVLGVPLVAVILWLMMRAGDYWWLWAWLVWMGFMLLMLWAFPVLIAPLFNKFTPLEDQELKARLERLLERCGFHSNGMFVMDGSKRSAHGNAYFTGFGRNKRIVFYDTLLKGLAPEEVEAVLAHELGHFKRHHVRTNLLFSAAMSLAGLALLGWLSTQAWFYHGLGVERVGPAQALLLFMLASPVFTFFLQPLTSMLSRRHEFQADEFAAKQADAHALISGLVKMYRDNASTLTPDPLYSAFYHSHPPAAVRIRHLQAQ